MASEQRKRGVVQLIGNFRGERVDDGVPLDCIIRNFGERRPLDKVVDEGLAERVEDPEPMGPEYRLTDDGWEWYDGRRL